MDEDGELDTLMEKMSSSLPSDSPLTRRAAPPSLPTTSPLVTRARKVTAPGLTSTFSLVSATDHISSLRDGSSTSLLSSRPLSVSNSSLDTTCSQDTPQATPTLPRRGFLGSSSDLPSLSRSSSTLSLASTSSRLSPIDSIIKHLRDRLSGCLFSGWYTERRYIEAVERYRDVVTVDPVETKLVKQVRYAIRKAGRILPENSFLGLAYVEEECRLYLHLGPGGRAGEAGTAFGHYWFHVRAIDFIQGLGFCIEVSVVRQFVPSDSETCWRCRQREVQEEAAPPVKIESVGGALGDLSTRLASTAAAVVQEAWHPASWWATVRPLLTPSHLVAATKFLLVLLLAALTGVAAGCRQLAGWSLQAIHELAFLVDRSTPFALGALAMVSKMVGGLYLLLAMVWRDVRKPAPRQPPGPPRTPQPPLALGGPPPPQHPGLAPRPPPHAAMDNMYSQGRTW